MKLPPHRILLDSLTIQTRVQELGQEISQFYQETDSLILVGILKGALYFLADLSRAISLPSQVDILAVSSYTGTQSSGTVTILKDLDIEIQGKDILIVEDILDTGCTLNAIKDCLASRHPRSLRICVFLDKPDRRIVPVPVDFTGFTIPNHFVIGYGLDLNQAFRNLPYIALLNPA